MSPYRILSLDGGGSKGFHTLGVLSQLEASLGSDLLASKFDLIYGTSTGAIIAAMIALGLPVAEIHRHYREHVPTVMGARTRRARTRALQRLADEVFGEKKFDSFKTAVGIVTTRWHEERPMIFKGSREQLRGGLATFVPGFGCSIADAVVASCSAYPYFDRKRVSLPDGNDVELIDGGYCANDPTLFAIADATAMLRHPREALRVVSISVGNYPAPTRYGAGWLVSRFFLVRLLEKVLAVNTTTMGKLADIFFEDVARVRIDGSFTRPEVATDFMEHRLNKLGLLYEGGKDSFRDSEAELLQMLSR